MLVPLERIEKSILLIRGQKVMLDADLAEMYGVKTKVLNQAVKRNAARFPADFMFRLTMVEKVELVTNCDRFRALKHSSSEPLAFTEHGAIMAAAVLNTPRAVEVSVVVVRAFVKLREMVASHRELAAKLAELEQKYDRKFVVVFEALRRLMKESEEERTKIGFQAGG